jgi:hypothetical protein
LAGFNPLFSVAALVFLAAVAWALGVAANLPLIGLHHPLLITLSAGASCRMLAVPVCSSGHYYPILLSIFLQLIITIVQPQVYPYK